MKLSVAYHPQTDGESERFHSSLLKMMRAYVNKYHSDWASYIPALLYAYHNTIHTATGFTPHVLLFGWCPRDLRAPLSTVETSGDPDIDAWLAIRAKDLKRANISLDAARDAMVRAHKASPKPHSYAPGDLVKISTRVLKIKSHVPSTQARKLTPKYIGPFSVVSATEHNVQLKLPEAYRLVHDRYHHIDVRPWLHTDAQNLEVHYPAVEPHPALNPVVQVLDRKRCGGRPRRITSLLDIPTQYLVVLKDGSSHYVPGSRLREPHERELVKKFELRFQRNDELPCNPVKDYSVSSAVPEEEYVSDDELDIVWHQEVSDQ